jgi:hypothetical protein
VEVPKNAMSPFFGKRTNPLTDCGSMALALLKRLVGETGTAARAARQNSNNVPTNAMTGLWCVIAKPRRQAANGAPTTDPRLLPQKLRKRSMETPCRSKYKTGYL